MTEQFQKSAHEIASSTIVSHVHVVEVRPAIDLALVHPSTSV